LSGPLETLDCPFPDHDRSTHHYGYAAFPALTSGQIYHILI
jgi:hypothetical protein